MFHSIKQSRRLASFVNFLILKNQRLTNAIRPYSYFVNDSSRIRICSTGQYNSFLLSNDQPRLVLTRNKHGSKKKKKANHQEEESSDEEDEEEEEDDEKDSEIKTFNVKSLRIDAILKAALGVSRSKVEEAFYQNKIRVNGKIIQKKSHNAKLNDEIDLIKGEASDHSDSIIVGRVKILKVQEDPDSGAIAMKAWRSKSLKIENYSDVNAWREAISEE